MKTRRGDLYVCWAYLMVDKGRTLVGALSAIVAAKLNMLVEEGKVEKGCQRPYKTADSNTERGNGQLRHDPVVQCL